LVGLPRDTTMVDCADGRGRSATIAPAPHRPAAGSRRSGCQTPNESRAASDAGRPASRIERWTASMS
jgi:hypothetical protein